MTDLPLPTEPRLPTANDLTRHARKHAFDAIDVLADCLRQPNPSSSKVAACKALLERGYGSVPSLEAKFRLLPEDCTFAHVLTDEDQPDE